MDARFGRTGDHDGGVAVDDEAAGVTDGMGARGAGGGDSMIGPLGGGLK